MLYEKIFFAAKTVAWGKERRRDNSPSY